MIKHSIVPLLIGLALIASTPQIFAAGADDEALRKVVADYNSALNACNVEGIVRMFERDAMRMPANQPPTVGEQNLRVWFTNYCSRTTAKLAFTVMESQVSGDLGWVRVDIGGALTAKSTDAVAPQDNQGILIIRRGADGVWRIARYINNSKKPLPPAAASN